jgi:hypothetical protein
MRRTVCLLAAPLVLPSFGSDVPKEYDGAKEKDELDGTWKCLPLEFDDGLNLRPLPEDTFRGGKWRQSTGKFLLTGTYTAQTGHKPANLDVTVWAGDKPYQTLK